MKPFKIEDGKFYVFGYHLHHGATGAAIVALGALIGGALMWHDRVDAPWIHG